MKITSTAFQNNSLIPTEYTCDGKNINPPLTIAEVPENTKSLAIIVEDPDAPVKTNFTHWVLFNISPETQEILENSIPPGSLQGNNDFGEASYKGPCPPKGIHHYIFTLYALDKYLDVLEGTTKEQVLDNMQGHIIESTHLIGIYSKE